MKPRSPPKLLTYLIGLLAIIIFYLLTAPLVSLWVDPNFSGLLRIPYPSPPVLKKAALTYITPMNQILSRSPWAQEVSSDYVMFVVNLLNPDGGGPFSTIP